MDKSRILAKTQNLQLPFKPLNYFHESVNVKILCHRIKYVLMINTSVSLF